MILFFQNNGILSCGFCHVEDVGVFCLNISKAAQIRGFWMLGVEVRPNLKPQLPNMVLSLYSAGVSSKIEVSECGYSPYGRGQTLQDLPIPYGQASAREIKKFPLWEKRTVMSALKPNQRKEKT